MIQTMAEYQKGGLKLGENGRCKPKENGKSVSLALWEEGECVYEGIVLLWQ